MKNILLIGLGRFGRHVAIQLNSLGHEVMAVDTNHLILNLLPALQALLYQIPWRW